MLLTVLFFQSLAVQFSRTIPVKGFFRFPSLSLTRDLYIISYLEAFVKRFFKSFLSFFELSCFSLRSFKTIRSLLADLDIISYLPPLVKGFRESFFRLFQTRSASSASLTAYLVYHISFALSRDFLKFLSICEIYARTATIYRYFVYILSHSRLISPGMLILYPVTRISRFLRARPCRVPM